MQDFIADFLRLENLLYDTVGVRPKIIRYPGGSNNTVSNRYGGAGMMRQIISEMSSRGYVHCDWNVDAGDATSAINNKSAIVRNALSQAAGKEKAIVLLHDAEFQKNTPVALPEIIQGLRAQGFVFDVLAADSYLVQFAR
jgi:peptidoglycan-N-acetylglucosamine deacetylase